MPIIQARAFQCNRCGYIWLPRRRPTGEEEPELPRVCAKCKSPYWNSPRTYKRRGHVKGHAEDTTEDNEQAEHETEIP